MIWVTGDRGMLGRELCELMENRHIAYCGTDRETSVLEPETIKGYALEHKPDWIVNCTGYTAVDRAEEDREAAFALNRDGAANLAKLASELNVPIIHISTDYIFDGTSSSPLTETAGTSPLGVYGESKLAGENEIRESWNKHYIIRTAWLYGKYGSNFVHTMLRLMNSRSTVKVVNDQTSSPTWARDLSEFILEIISRGRENYGIYHFSGEGQCSWYEFASTIYQLGKSLGVLESVCNVVPCISEEFPTAAKRPEYSLLSKEKVKIVFNYNVPEWQESIQKFIKEIDRDEVIQRVQ